VGGFGIDPLQFLADGGVHGLGGDGGDELFILRLVADKLLTQRRPADFRDEKPQFRLITAAAQGLARFAFNAVTLLGIPRR